jgi:hypothetical protein
MAFDQHRRSEGDELEEAYVQTMRKLLHNSLEVVRGNT